MPEDEVLTPGTEGAGEAVEPTEPEAQPQEPNDPLDDIQDETARAQAKRDRAIARRHAKEPEPAAPQPDYAKKDDLAVIVTNQAKALVSEEVREHWDELMAIPLAGANPLDAHSIAANMADRLVLFKAKQTGANPVKELSETTGTRGTTGKTPDETKPVFRPLDLDSQAEQLYGGKS